MASSSASGAAVEIRHCHTLAEFERCMWLERTVWGGAELDAVPLPIFVVAHETGGQVFGAFAGKEMIGFTLAMASFHPPKIAGKPPQLFLHSHMTAVLAEYRDGGVGRQLKLFQRQDAVSRGIPLVEWTFDPLEMRNAHFNLMRLGAVVRRFIPNCYGLTSSPLHAGLPTDRFVAEWWLRSPRVTKLIDQSQPARMPGREANRVLVPGNIDELRRDNLPEAARQQTRIREELQHWLGQGFAITAIERTSEGGTYLLEPFEAIQGELNCE